MPERPITCKSGPPTQDGSRSSNMNQSSSQTSKVRYLMLQVQRIMKVNQLLCGARMVEQTRDGQLFMLINQPRSKIRELTMNSDSMSTDHSTSDLDFQ